MSIHTIAVRTDKAKAQRAIKWLRTHHQVLAFFFDGQLSAPDNGKPEEMRQLIEEALKVTSK